jgi:hypothetical protein
MIEQVLHHIHLIGRDVVERNGTVAAAAHALRHGIIDVLLVPEIVRHVAGDEMVLRYEGEESTAAQRIPALQG